LKKMNSGEGENKGEENEEESDEARRWGGASDV
jgi:hypothetical protein